MKIALFVPTLEGGGAERMVVDLANALASSTVTVDLVVGSTIGPNLSRVASPVRIVDLGAPQMRRAILPLAAYIRREAPDALLATLENANIAALAARAITRSTLRVVVRVASLSQEMHKHAGLRERFVYRVQARVLQYADLVIAISRGVASDLMETTRIAPGKLRVIYNPAFSADLADLANASCEHEWMSGPVPVVLGVGRLDANKNFAALIRAFAILRSRQPARLIILGSGPERAALIELSRKHDIERDVTLPGFVDNPYSYMKKAAALAVPSRSEGFGNVIVEALALGTPVVATSGRGGPGEILEGGKWGRLVPIDDDEAMAAALAAALADGRRCESIQRARDFSMASVAADYRLALGIEA